MTSNRPLTNPAPTNLTAIAEGTWLADGFPLQQRKARRVHFFPDGEDHAICMRALTRPRRPLRFDPKTRLTEVDPRLGDRQFRTACLLCSTLLTETEAPEDAGIAPLPAGPMVPWAANLLAATVYPVRVTRAMGTLDGVARFAVVEGRSLGVELDHIFSLFGSTAESVELVPVAVGSEDE